MLAPADYAAASGQVKTHCAIAEAGEGRNGFRIASLHNDGVDRRFGIRLDSEVRQRGIEGAVAEPLIDVIVRRPWAAEQLAEDSHVSPSPPTRAREYSRLPS